MLPGPLNLVDLQSKSHEHAPSSTMALAGAAYHRWALSAVCHQLQLRPDLGYKFQGGRVAKITIQLDHVHSGRGKAVMSDRGASSLLVR